MSFFGNSPRPDLKSTPEPAGRTPRSSSADSATLLGSASDILGRQNEPPLATAMPAPDTRPMTPPATPTPPDRCTNVIAAGARWKGTLTVEDSVRIDGNFAGEINAKGTVHIAEGAHADAKVRAGFVVVAGNFQGEIRCEQRVDLLPKSRVNGEINTKVLSVHEGAIVDGRIQMTGGAAETEGRLSTGRQSRGATSESEAETRREDRRERTPVGPTRNGVTAPSIDE